MPGAEAPAGSERDLWWYRPLSLEELTALLRFVSRRLAVSVARVVLDLRETPQCAPSELSGALVSGLSGSPRWELLLLMDAQRPRMRARLTRELHLRGVHVACSPELGGGADMDEC
ncbi:hypothetical protein DL240_12605 [Lujinxingia litoralis]|uniref:STAS domain-containing protein n=2 Tax=Lujinxingia litoralis TaxID=2211119 RepID=A0A328C7S7_9DELT|nr:hypothetical protein DL240_12605 [Lujinxingia litoralis]